MAVMYLVVGTGEVCRGRVLPNRGNELAISGHSVSDRGNELAMHGYAVPSR